MVGKLECVGSGRMGQTEIPVGMDSNVLTVSAGTAFTCAVKVNQLMCWGDNQYDQLNVPSALRVNR